MGNIFIIIEIPEEKKMNTGTFYLTRDANIWWSTMKHRLDARWIPTLV